MTWIGTQKKCIKKEKKTVEVSVQCGNAVKKREKRNKKREKSIRMNGGGA